MIETELRELFEQADGAVPADGTDVGGVMVRGRRRRRRNHVATAVASVVAVAAVVIALGTLARGPTPGVDVTGGPADGERIAIFLCDHRVCPAATEEQIQVIERTLEQDAEVGWFEFEDSAAAYERFQRETSDRPDVKGIQPGMLPASFRVVLIEGTDIRDFIDRYSTLPGVEHVRVDPGSDAAGFVQVPNVIGLSPEEAGSALSASGLAWTTEGDGPSVTGQDPEPGTTVEKGTLIALRLGSPATSSRSFEDPELAGLCEAVESARADGEPGSPTTEQAIQLFVTDHSILEQTTIEGFQIKYEGEVVGRISVRTAPAGGYYVASAEWCYPEPDGS